MKYGLSLLGRNAGTPCIDAAYFCRCSVVCRPYVCVCVGYLSVGHNRELAKTAEPIEMPSEVWSREGSRNHVSGEGLDLAGEGVFGGISPILHFYCEVQGISGVIQSHSVGGSSDVTCRWHTEPG